MRKPCYVVSLSQLNADILTTSEMPPFLVVPEKSCLGMPVRWESMSCKVTPLSISSSMRPHSGMRSRIFVVQVMFFPLSWASVRFEMSSPTENERNNLLFDAIEKTELEFIGEPSPCAIPYAPNSCNHPLGCEASFRTTATERPDEPHFCRRV